MGVRAPQVYLRAQPLYFTVAGLTLETTIFMPLVRLV